MFTVNTYNEVQDLAIVAPSIQAIDINLDPDTGVLSFTSGNGNKRLVVLSQYPIIQFPLNQLSYYDGDCIDKGIVVYRGSGDEVDISQYLSVGKWYVQVFEFNGYASIEKYLIDSSSDNPIDFILDETAGVFDETFDDTFE